MNLYIGDIIRYRYVEKYFASGNGRLLDAGCGDNIYKELVEKKGYEWYGIDVKAKPPAIYGDITNIPFPSDHFAAVICVDVLEHVSEDLKALKEIHRVLKPRGQLIIHTPNKDQTHIIAEFQDNPEHIRRGYSTQELSVLFNEASFKEIWIHPTFNILECVSWELLNLRELDQQSLERLLTFDINKYKNLGWICITGKG